MKKIILACILLLAFEWPSLAAVDLPEVVVTGEAIGDDSEDDKYLSPGAVTVIRPEQYEGEARTLPELVENVPGLRVIRSRGRHGYTVASVRGSTSSQVAVYVDGVLMNLGSEAAVDLSTIPTETIERIEVYRGYVPAKFGAQAMGGVINVITKKPDAGRTRATLSAGSFGRYKGTLAHSMPLGSGVLFGSIGYETYKGDYEYWNDNGTPFNPADDYEGKRRDNGFNNTDVLLKWNDDHWRAKFSMVRTDRDLSLQAPGLDRQDGSPQRPGATLDTKRYDFLLGRSQTAGVLNWDWEIKYTKQNKSYDSRRGDQLSLIGGLSVSRSDYDTSRWSATLTANAPIGERHFLEGLIEYADDRLDVDGDTVTEYLGGISKYNTRSWAATLQDSIMLDREGTFMLTPSLRWYKDDDDDKLTWQVALSKEFSRGLMLKATYGTYSRAPNMYEKYGDGAFILPPRGDLQWETGTQYDVSLLWSASSERVRSSASISYFDRDSKNLIEFMMTDPRYGRYANIAKAHVRGVELEAGLDWTRWAFSLSGTWMDSENLTPDDAGSVRQYGKTMPNRPEWSATARLTHKFDRGSIFAEYQYVGENYADSAEMVKFDAQNVWNIGVKYRLSKTSELTLGVRDLFDSARDLRMRPDGISGPTRMLWYPLEGRSFYATLNMEF